MNGKRKGIMVAILAAMVLALVGVGGYYWYNSTYYISTEDAKIAGDIAKASPQMAARIIEIDFQEGDRVAKGQVLARQDMTGLEDSKIETSVIRAPISGIVIKKQGLVGEVASAGQAIAMIVDPSQVYVSANIEETALSKLQQGQTVDISIDQLRGKQFHGSINSIGKAAASTFSLLSASSSSTFTKVVQKVPVKIKLLDNDGNLLVGTNAMVKIRIK